MKLYFIFVVFCFLFTKLEITSRIFLKKEEMSKFIDQLKLYLLIAFSYLRSNKNRKLPSIGVFLSFGSIALSVCVLIVVNSIMRGFEIEFIGKVLGSSAHVTIFDKVDDEKIKDIEGYSYVKSVSKAVYGQGLISNEKLSKSSGVFVKGVDFDEYFKNNKVKCLFCNKSELNSDDFSVVIGYELSRQIGVRTGELISIMVPSIRSTIFGNVPMQKTLRIAGVVSFGISQLDSTFVLMNINGARALYKDITDSEVIDVFLQNPMKTEDFSHDIGANYGFTNLSDWKVANRDILNAIEIEGAVMFLLMSFFVLVSMFSVLGICTMCVYEKKKNIAILQSMGMSKRDIGCIFFLFGFTIVFIGVCFGCGIGILVAKNIDSLRILIENFAGIKLFNSAVYFLSNLPSIVEFWDILKICFLSFLFGIFVCILPARKATKIDLVDSLRYF